MTQGVETKNVGLIQEKVENVEFTLLPRDEIESRQRSSYWNDIVLPKLVGNIVTSSQLRKSLKAVGKEVSQQYMYHILEKWAAKGVCKKRLNSSLGCNEYEFKKPSK